MEIEDSQNADKIIGDCTLLLGDCLERMKQIPGKSIDAIICDLPYGTTACKWDTVIPFEPLWAQYKRIIKDRGAIALFGSEPFSSYLRMSNIKEYKYDWIWEKTRPTGFAHSKNKPMKKHENISIFSSGATSHANLSNNRMNYYPQGLIYGVFKRKQNSKTRANKMFFAHRGSHKDEFISNYTNYPTTILMFPNNDRGNFTTQKPVSLLEYLIKTYTLENETVLDNCMGSGTTGVACINTSRKFIGIEKEQKYFDISIDRINKAYSEKASELFQ